MLLARRRNGGHRFHLLHNELDGGGLLVRRIAVLPHNIALSDANHN